MKPTITGASSAPAVQQHRRAWDMGWQHGREAAKACPYHPGTDNALSYWAGYKAGLAVRVGAILIAERENLHA